MIQKKATGFRWVVVTLLFALIIINYIDRSSIAFALDEIKHTFHFNDDQLGLILGAFGLGYVITTYLGGIAVDRYGSRIIFTVIVFFWAVTMFFSGFATGFLMLFVARVSLGLAEGPNFPALTRAVGDWLPSYERVKALSYSLIAVPIALAISAPLVSELIVQTSWRIMFHILGVTAIVWVPVWWWLFRDLPQESARVNKKELHLINESSDISEIDKTQFFAKRKNIRGLWKFLFSNSTLLSNYFAFFVFGYFLFFFMTWLPTYLETVYHLKLKEVGMFSFLPWALAAFMMLAMGYVSDYIYKKTKNFRYSRSCPILISQLLAALCIVPIVLTTNLFVAITFISLAVGFTLSTNAAYYAINIDVAKERAGTALGIMDAAFAIAGIIAPTLTGWVISITGHYTDAFWVLSILALTSTVLVFIFHHPESSKHLDQTDAY